MEKECCKNCTFCHELWYWSDYPRGKQSGYCCTMLKDTGDDVVMQLYGDIEVEMCEVFTRRKDNEAD